MDDVERGYLVAEYVKQIMLGVDLLMVDPDNLAFLKEGIERTAEQVRMGFAFPLTSYSKVEKLNASNDLLSAVHDLCKERERYRAATEKSNSFSLDDEVMRTLGIG